MGWKGALAALALVATTAYGDEATYRQIAQGCSSGYEDFFMQVPDGKLESIKTGVEKIGMDVKVHTDMDKVEAEMKRSKSMLLGHCHPTQDPTLEYRVNSTLRYRKPEERQEWYEKVKRMQSNNFIWSYTLPSVDDIYGLLRSSIRYSEYQQDPQIEFPVVTQWNDALRITAVTFTPEVTRMIHEKRFTELDARNEAMNYLKLQQEFIHDAWVGKDPLIRKDPDLILAAFEKLLEEKSNVRLRFEKY